MNDSPMHKPHICFSGDLACSGCYPCDACAMVVKQNVLVAGLRAEQTALIAELQAALAEQRPVNLQALAETFFRGWAQGWRDLHSAMAAEPAEQRPYRMTNVTAMFEAAQAYRVMQSAGMANTPSNPRPSAETQNKPETVTKESTARAEAATPEPAVTQPASPPQVPAQVFRPEVIIPSAADIDRMEEATRLTAEDILATVTRLDEGDS